MKHRASKIPRVCMASLGATLAVYINFFEFLPNNLHVPVSVWCAIFSAIVCFVFEEVQLCFCQILSGTCTVFFFYFLEIIPWESFFLRFTVVSFFQFLFLILGVLIPKLSFHYTILAFCSFLVLSCSHKKKDFWKKHVLPNCEIPCLDLRTKFVFVFCLCLLSRILAKYAIFYYTKPKVIKKAFTV